MHDSVTHLSAIEMQAALAEVVASPRDSGRLEAIFVRPVANVRQTLGEACLTLEGGIDGDRWLGDSYYRLEDGSPDPRCQVSLMNVRFLRQIAGHADAMCLAGDNLIVDFDLSAENVVAGTQLAIGPDVVLEISNLLHSGCGKFAERYGNEARALVNTKHGRALHLRGLYARIISGGRVKIGDVVTKRPAV